MKNRLLALFALVLLLAATTAFWPQKADLPAVADKQAPASLPTKQLRRDLSHLMRLPSDDDTAFWTSAIVPEPEKPRIPTSATIQGTPAAADAAQKTAARLREIETAAATPENIRLYNQQAILYYDQDPAAATDWLNSTQGFEHLGPALASIAASLGERGHLDVAHVVIETIPDPDARRTAVLDLYSLRARNGQVTRDELAQAGWDTADIEHIFQSKGD
jgi:hypothetical protein